MEQESVTIGIHEIKRIDASKDHAKTWLFLTYMATDTPLTRESVYLMINKKYPVDKALICEEVGNESGKLHHHAIIKFKNRVRIRNYRVFDINIVSRTIYANIGEFSKGDLYKVMSYTMKNDETPYKVNMDDEYESFTALQTKFITNKTSINDIYDMVKGCETRSEAYSAIRRNCNVGQWMATKSVIDSSISCSVIPINKSYCDPEFDDPTNGGWPYKRDAYLFPLEFEQWMDQLILMGSKLGRWPVFLFTGISGLGKTGALKSMGPHLSFNTGIAWKNIFSGFPEDTRYIIYDDIKPAHLEELKNQKSLLCGMMTGMDLDIKYANAEKVVVNIPSIIICNEAPRWVEEEYWKANLYWFDIQSEMINDNPLEKRTLQYEIKNVPSIKFRPIPGHKADIPKFPVLKKKQKMGDW